MAKRVLVIGGCGFIGSHVVDQLLARGMRLRILDRQGERFRRPVSGVEYVQGSFLDRMAVLEALAGIDAVVHLASTTFPVTAEMDPKSDVSDNLLGTLNLLEAMLSQRVHRLLFLSSGGTVYGVPQVTPITEEHPLNPINSYGIVKVAIEHYVAAFRRTRGLSPVVIRASNPYGPRQGHIGVQGVIATFLRRALSGDPIEVWGDGTVVRDFLHVRDLADLCARALLSEEEGTFNAGSGEGRSINEIIELVRGVAGSSVDIRYSPGRSTDTPVSILDVSRAHRTFGWTPVTPLESGIAQTWQWLKSLEYEPHAKS